MAKIMGTKVEVRTIPLHGLFIHRKQVWRSLGKLRAESHSTSAQKVYMNDHNTEVYTENADFIDGLKVTPYYGELTKTSKDTFNSMSHYQRCLMQKSI
mgnify:CR=1 FL=1|jgi:hypothetical protein